MLKPTMASCWMRSNALCVLVCGVIEFSIEKAPLIKPKNKRKMQSKRRLPGTKSYLQSLSSKLFWLMCESVPWMEFAACKFEEHTGTCYSASTAVCRRHRRGFCMWCISNCYGFLESICSLFLFGYLRNVCVCVPILYVYMCVYGCQVVYCVNRQIKISEEMALPVLTPPPPQLYLSSCPPSDFSPSDPYLLL